MNFCPCCNDILLSYVGTNGSYWFCRSCWQAMPVCTRKQSISSSEAIPGELPTQLNPSKKNSHLLSFRRKHIIKSSHPLAS